MENVRYLLVHSLSAQYLLCAIESLGIREIPLEADLHHTVHVLDDRLLHVDLDDHDLCGLPPEPSEIHIHREPRYVHIFLASPSDIHTLLM